MQLSMPKGGVKVKIGAIDIGTNSVRLLVAESGQGELNRLVERMEVPRLGEDINQTGYLKETAMERTIAVLKEYKEIIADWGSVPKAVATSAVRDASNQQEFVSQVKKETGIKINVIAGEKEAYLSYLGVAAELTDLQSKKLVVDIGGGSTELITGQAEDLLTYESINLGAVRLKEEFGEDIKQLYSKVEKQIVGPEVEVEQLVGVGGTITTLAAVNQKLETYNRAEVHGLKLAREEIQEMLDYIAAKPLSLRAEVPGLSRRRADIIVPGIVILIKIMEKVSRETITVSDTGLLEGIVYQNI